VSLTLSDAELQELTNGLTQPAAQLRELHKQGFTRACRPRGGPVVLYRAHFEAVEAARQPAAPTPTKQAQAVTPPAAIPWEETPLGRRQAEWRANAEPLPKPRKPNAAERREIARRRAEEHAAIVRHHAAKRRSARLRRTPPWANMEAIQAIYARARELTVSTGIEHHVDHRYPLQGELVSGLHVAENLQVLTGSENSRKRNRFEVE
jgi:hypothetical protein